MVCGRLLGSTEASKKLLKCVRDNDTNGISKLVERHGENLLSFKYREYRNHDILIIACNDYSSLLKNEKVPKFDSFENIKKSTITELLELGATPTKPSENDNWEAIHYATITTKAEKLSAILDSLNIEEANSLIYCSQYIRRHYSWAKYHPESYSNNALHVLLKYGNRNENFLECCQLLIDKGVSIDQQDSNGETPLDLMRKDSDLADLAAKVSGEEKTEGKLTFKLINANNEEEFLKLKLDSSEANDVDGLNEELSSCTLLQLCCFKGLRSCVEHLLKSGASPNKILPKNKKTPTMIVIRRDHEDIVKLLLDNHDLQLPYDILIKIQTRHTKKKNVINNNINQGINNCLKLVLNHLKSKDRGTIRNFLLETDELKRTALHYAVLHHRSPEIILELLSLGSPLTKKDIFGYTPLQTMEPPVLEIFFDNCVYVSKEFEDIGNMLYTLQNEKNKFQVEMNYEALLVGQESSTHESEFLQQLIKAKQLTFLLKHPVVSSYLELKWQKFKWCVLLNLFLYFVAYASLLFYGFMYNTMTDVSNSLILTSLLLITVRAAIQLILFQFDYIKRVENIIDLVLTSGIIYILAAFWVPTLNNQNMRVAFSIVFLTSTLGIFLHLGNLPLFTTKVIVLRQTCMTFLKYIIFYVFPLLAFVFCFYMLRETDDQNFFKIFYDVVTMFAGDPSSDYPNQFATNPIFSHTIYICFIVIIGIILQNLLIGLAVNDLQEIQNEAEFIDKKERANYISNIERVLSSQHQKLSYVLIRKILRKLLTMSSVFRTEYILVIEPYNNGRIFPKSHPETHHYIKDNGVIILLEKIFKNLTGTNNETDAPYSLKSIHQRLQAIESVLHKLDKNV